MPSLRVVALITARPDTIEKTKSGLLALIAPTRQEPGCVSYQLQQGATDPAQFAMIEEWESAAALDRHMQSPHLLAAYVNLPGLLAASPDIRRYTLLA